VRENEISLRKWSIGTALLRILEGTPGQGCKMLDRKYGKCLSNFWQNIFESGDIFVNIDFSLKNGNIYFIAFCDA